MKLLTLDPSTTRIGYAVMSDHRTLHEAGAIRPAAGEADANGRVRSMAGDVAELLREQQPDVVLVEDTGSHVHAGRQGGGAGLMVYGKGVGYVLRVCDEVAGAERVQTVETQVWSRGARKEKRQRQVAAQFSQYDARKDKGCDISDAIAMAQWWFGQQMIPGGMQQPRRPERKRTSSPKRKRDDGGLFAQPRTPRKFAHRDEADELIERMMEET